jgi:hypothetical protein
LDFIEELTYCLPDIASSTYKDAAKILSHKQRDHLEITERLEDLVDLLKNQQDANLESTSSFQVLTTQHHATSIFEK